MWSLILKGVKWAYFHCRRYLCMWGLFFLKEETNKDYSFPAGLEDHILGENVSPNTSISGLVPSELTQSNTSLGSSSSSGDVGKLQCPTGMGKSVLRVLFFFFSAFAYLWCWRLSQGLCILDSSSTTQLYSNSVLILMPITLHPHVSILFWFYISKYCYHVLSTESVREYLPLFLSPPPLAKAFLTEFMEWGLGNMYFFNLFSG